MQDRRSFLTSGAAAAALAALPGLARAAERIGGTWTVDMVIRKNPGCMCCNAWADHLAAYGITTRIEEHPELSAFKDEMAVPEDLRSCHTGVIQDYVIEGHVPAEDVRKLLDTRPDVRGIAVGGMPAGSPGMEAGDRVDPYEVIAFGGGDGPWVFAEHG